MGHISEEPVIKKLGEYNTKQKTKYSGLAIADSKNISISNSRLAHIN